MNRLSLGDQISTSPSDDVAPSGASRRGPVATSDPVMAAGVDRYRFGDVEIVVISDGPMHLGPPGDNYPLAPRQQLQEIVARDGNASGEFVVQQNCLVARMPGQCLLVDAGVGPNPFFGPTTGRLRRNLNAAGIAPEDVTHVLLTHAHLDHAGGLITVEGEAAFPNARILVTQTDFEFWTREESVPPGGLLAQVVRGVAAALLPLRERIEFIAGDIPVPGVRVVASPGHTLGHVSFLISAGRETILTLGDVAHHPLSLEYPDWQFAGDADGALAVSTRRRLFDMAATERFLVHSYHFPRPGLGFLERTMGNYAFVPVSTES
ncbi:MBL fold metallo-hydrolase [Inquilinus limosus]|nr:MBL fold metallo-hydrolase [Inquilinus limosus]